MRKILLFAAFLFLVIQCYSQTIVTSDTIREIKYLKTAENVTTKRNCYQYSPLDEDVNQNFKNLFVCKKNIEDVEYYVMQFDKNVVNEYGAKSYITLAVEFDRESASRYDALESSSFFAFTEKQYQDMKECLKKGDGKILKIKSKIHGDFYTGTHSLKLAIDSRYKEEDTFVMSFNGDNVNFRLPERYYTFRYSKKLFKERHFECSKEEFSKLIIEE